jgi:predicted GNAT family acetyltransferase
MTDSAPAAITVADNPQRMRFEITVDGQVGGFADYRRHGQSVTFTHTEIDDEYEGRGLGGTLARAVLDDARARGLRVVPQCQFIAAWIQRHPDYADLVDSPTP